MYGRNQAVKKPDYMDTRNRFGIFYKTDEDRVKGEEVLKILEEIVTNINNFKDKPNTSKPTDKLADVASTST